MTRISENHVSKVPAVTLVFWIIKIAATTLGETGGDTVTMTMNLGYLTGTAIFLSALAVLVCIQISAKRFHPVLYSEVFRLLLSKSLIGLGMRRSVRGFTGYSLCFTASSSKARAWSEVSSA